MAKVKTCFVIAPIGEEGSDIRERSDIVFQYVIRPVTEGRGYETVMAHHLSKPGSITGQIIERILNSDLVVADLTGHNGNVMYELALCHATKKAVIQIIREGEKLPFDVSHQRTIFLNHSHIPSVEKAKEELGRQIHEVEKGEFLVDNPISTGVDMSNLRNSPKSTDTILHNIVSLLQEIRATQQDQKRYSTVISIPSEHVISSEVLRHQGTSNAMFQGDVGRKIKKRIPEGIVPPEEGGSEEE